MGRGERLPGGGSLPTVQTGIAAHGASPRERS